MTPKNIAQNLAIKNTYRQNLIRFNEGYLAISRSFATAGNAYCDAPASVGCVPRTLINRYVGCVLRTINHAPLMILNGADDGA